MSRDSGIIEEVGIGNSRPISYKTKGDCWILSSHSFSNPGDGYTKISRFGKSISLKYHVASLFHGEPIDSKHKKYLVYSSCGDYKCIRPDHLVIDTVAPSGRWKLSREKVSEIHQQLSKSRKSFKKIAAEYNIDTSTLSNINHGKTWNTEELDYPLRKEHFPEQTLEKIFYRNGRMCKQYASRSHSYRKDMFTNREVERKCISCFSWKPSSLFVTKEDNKYKCLLCRRSYHHLYSLKNKERLNEVYNSYYQKNKLNINKQNRENRAKNYIEYSKTIHNWHLNNPQKKYEYRLEREQKLALLEFSLTTEDYENVLGSRFNNQCALTNSTKVHLEHFIPVFTGHGGTTLGNCYPLDGSLNGSKGSSNPFEWINRDDLPREIDSNKWDKLIEHLATQNNLSTSEFKEYVYWCFDNPRTIEDLKEDNTPSLELWKLSREEANNV